MSFIYALEIKIGLGKYWIVNALVIFSLLGVAENLIIYLCAYLEYAELTMQQSGYEPVMHGHGGIGRIFI